jgi:hypothetical protein
MRHSLQRCGAVLIRAVPNQFGIGPLDPPWANGPSAEDIVAHLPLFKDHAPAAALRAKAGAWDESNHPRWPTGSGDHQGGRFQSAGAGDEGQPAAQGISHNAGPPPLKGRILQRRTK